MINRLILKATIFLCLMASSLYAADSDPRIVVSPQYLVLYAVQGSSTAQSQTFKISNGGQGTLRFNLTESTGWYTMNPSSGTVTNNSVTITVNANPAGLTTTASPYIGDITITNTDIPQDVKKVRVRLSILNTDAYVHAYQYDAQGNVTRRITPNGEIIEYVYDTLGKLVHIYYPDGKEVHYAYDATGNRTSMTDWHGTTNYGYDQLRRLRSVTYPSINSILYDYDRSGKLTQIIYPDQKTVGYGYDMDGRLTTVTNAAGVTSYEFDSSTNNLKKKTLPNDVYTDYVYDPAKRITDTVNKKSNGTLISSYHYTYDANNNITQEVETTSTGVMTKDYIYDKLNRLKRADYSDGTLEAFTYDSMGNRLTQTTQTGTINYEYDSDNRLLKAGSTFYFYDKNGNQIKKVSPEKTETFQYDCNNMLTQYSNGTDNVIYQYDGDRNRIAKISNGVVTTYINDINRPIVQVIMEVNANLAVTKKYVYGYDLISQEAF